MQRIGYFFLVIIKNNSKLRCCFEDRISFSSIWEEKVSCENCKNLSNLSSSRSMKHSKTKSLLFHENRGIDTYAILTFDPTL